MASDGPDGGSVTPQVEIRAAWILEHIRRFPAMRYGPRITAIGKMFGVKRSAAAESYTRALELRREHISEVVKTYHQHVVQASLEDEEECRRKGDLKTANRIRMDLSRMLGLHAPDRVEHSFGVKKAPPRLADMTEEQLALIAAADGGTVIDAVSSEVPLAIDASCVDAETSAAIALKVLGDACATCRCMPCSCATLDADT